MTLKQKPVLRVYRVLEIVQVTDGDSLWALLERGLGTAGKREIIERDYREGTNIRLDDGLLGLNTPEKRKDPVGWAAAKEDLEAYFSTAAIHGGGFTFREYGEEGFGRTLGNFHPINGGLLDPVRYMINRGWASYK